MTSRTTVVKKTYGTSWISSIILGIILGIIGLLITHTWEGFAVGFVMTFLVEIIVLANLIPFIGIYFYWIWANWVCDWLISIAGIQDANFQILKFVAIVLIGILGFILWIVITVIALVVIGAIIVSFLDNR